MLNASCDNGISQWSLTLGEGTGRAGEKVLEVTGQPIPGFVLPQPIDDQPAAFLREQTSADAAPILLAKADLTLLEIAADGSVTDGGSVSSSSSGGFLGAAGLAWLLIGAPFLWARRRTTA
jgi:hypothetical protein